jgi:hypothetical protein
MRRGASRSGAEPRRCRTMPAPRTIRPSRQVEDVQHPKPTGAPPRPARRSQSILAGAWAGESYARHRDRGSRRSLVIACRARTRQRESSEAQRAATFLKT